MRRYLLVLVTIAVVLSLALVGCVGTQPQPPQPPDGGGGGTPEPTPTEFVPSPADGAKVLAGSEVTFDWSTWEEAKNATWARFYYSWGDCDKPGTWQYVQLNKDPCCPLETKYATTLNQCGVFWWKVEICTDEGTKVKGPFKLCSVPGFIVELFGGDPTPVLLGKATVIPGKETGNITLDACKLPRSFDITVTATAVTSEGQPIVCATTTYKVELSSEAKSGPWFILTENATGTWNSGTTVNATELATVQASQVVCTAMFGETIATVSFTVFPDIPGGGCCPPVIHCCKTEYTVTIELEGDEPELDLWSACGPCGGECECGWLVLKLDKCFELVEDIPTATVTIKDGVRFIRLGVNSLDPATLTYYYDTVTGWHFWCLDDRYEGPGTWAIEKGKSYIIEVPRGAFKFENANGVEFGWPCADKEFGVTAK
ncbi:hypothetical protein [Pseudothermotoga sp.]